MEFDLVDEVYSELSKHLSQEVEYHNKCSTLEKEKNYQELFETLLKETETLFSKKEEEDIFNFFVLLYSIPLENDKKLDKIVEKIISEKNVSSNLKLKILSELYNSNFESISLLKKIIQFCIETNQTVNLTNFSNFSKEELKDIYILNSKMFKGKQSYEQLINFLKIEPKDENIRKEALTLGIKTPDVFSFDSIILNDDFKNDDTFNEISNLLKQKKFASSEKVTKELKEDFELKLRLLHLTTYSGVIDYETIMKDLKIEKDQVEEFIFDAVSNKLIKVYIDQNEWKIHFLHSNELKDWKGIKSEIENLTNKLK
eukprot:gene1588-12713_t